MDRTPGQPSLLERDAELTAIDTLLDRACEGGGGALVIEGLAGLGKTALLDHAHARGRALGMHTVSACGAQGREADSWGVVRQLAAPLTSALPAPEVGAPPAEPLAILHALYWQCVETSDATPLLMLVDDLQWADDPSARFVDFLAGRLQRLPIALVVATEPPLDRAPAAQVHLVVDPAHDVRTLAALSASAVDEWVRATLSESADGALSRASHDVTHGNPFLVRELLREIVADGPPGTGTTAERVRAGGRRAISQVVRARLDRLPDAAGQLAAALAAVDPDTPPADIATLAGLPDDAARSALSALEEAGLVEGDGGVRFTHPIVRAAVHEDLSPQGRSALHGTAARRLAERGADPSEVAGHLLHVAPAGDRWIVQTLRTAAARATGTGDPATAQRLLARALEESGPGAPERAELLAELACAGIRSGNVDGSRRLAEALDLRDDDAPELTRPLLAELVGAGVLSAATAGAARSRLAGMAALPDRPTDPLEALRLAVEAFDTVADLRPAQEAIALGRQALQLDGGSVAVDPVLGEQLAIVARLALVWAEDFDHVFALSTEALADGRERGSPLVAGCAAVIRAMCGYRMGRLLDAEADAMTALELARDAPALRALLAPALACALASGVERGHDLDELHHRAEQADTQLGALTDTQLSWARGELCLAREDWEGAVRAFETCAQRGDPGYGTENPAMIAWREGSAIALHRLGEPDRARRLTADAVARAQRFGAPRAFGVALRADALVAPAPARVTGLRRAVEVLRESGSPLELVRAEADLGAALRAGGEVATAVEQLTAALLTASQLGAMRLADQIRAELADAGEPLLCDRADGDPMLTASERRVAELAACGTTDREIAQALFVTEVSVETDLGHVYEKLGVRSRRALPERLGLATA